MILLDSSFVMALYNTRDGHHSDAEYLIREIIDKKFGEVLISDYVFDEVATGLMKSIGHGETIKICQMLLDSSYLAMINEPLFMESFEMFKKQRSTTLSFTDCTNVVLMEDRGIRNIATFDNDFKSIKSINVVQ